MSDILVMREQDTHKAYDLSHVNILEGDGRAEGKVFLRDASPSDTVTSGIVTCQPGQMRSPASPRRELLYAAEGEAVLELDTGEQVELSTGDTVIIPAGHEVTWTFKTEFRQFFVFGV